MKLEEIWLGNKTYSLTGEGYNPEGKIMDGQTEIRPDQVTEELRLAMMVLAICNNSTLQKDPETDKWEGIGDPTEVSLEVACRKAGLGRDQWLGAEGWKLAQEIPFDSDRMRMSVVGTLKNGKGFVLSKGAPGQILKVSLFPVQCTERPF